MNKIKLVIVITVLAVMCAGCVSQESGQISALAPPPSQEIVITYTSELSDTIGMYSEAQEGKQFLIVTLEIENKGYDEFSTNSFYWGVEADKIKYTPSYETYSIDDKLELVEIQDGGKIKGSIVFEVPEGTENYKLIYETFRNYNIKWVQE